MDSRFYPRVEADVSKLVAELRNVFDQDYEVQRCTFRQLRLYKRESLARCAILPAYLRR